MSDDLEMARDVMRDQKLAFVVVRRQEILAQSASPGIRDLLQATDQLGPKLAGAALADKVVGKAVAMIAWHAGIREIYAGLLSDLARYELQRAGIPYEYERSIPMILNRDGTDMWPLEKTVYGLVEPGLAVAALRRRFSDESGAVRQHSD